MARALAAHFFRRFRFAAMWEDKEGMHDFALRVVESDPFNGEIHLHRAIQDGEKMIPDFLPPVGQLSVWLLDPHLDKGKRITVTYDGIRSIPFALDAMNNDGVAVERVVLMRVKYQGSQDVEREKLPPSLQRSAWQGQTKGEQPPVIDDD